MRVRFAHAPDTGLHLASARLAVVAHGFARRLGGTFQIRVDNLASHGDAEPLLRDLAWLGVTWDALVHQADRRERYAEAAEALKAAGRLYPCFETTAELEAKRDHRVKRGQPPIYDRAMLRLTPEQRARAEAGGKRPHWRFKLSDAPMQWDDQVLGRCTEKLSAMSDPILLRADGTPTAALTAAVDDRADAITHLIRGAEQVSGTAVQLDVAAALGGGDDMTIAHLPVLTERQGRRPEGLSIKQLRADGMEPEAVARFLGGLGVAPGALFDLAAYQPARFEIGGLLAANRAALAALDHAAVAERLPPGATEAFWTCVRGHIDLLPEARGWWDAVAGEIVPPVIEGEDAVLRVAAGLLPDEPWDASVWPVWRDNVATAAGRPAPAVAPILRLALTGEEVGPDMASLLPLIGRGRALRRLRGAQC